MFVHAVRTEFSMSVWIVCRDVTADENAFAFALALHPWFAIAFAALHPFAKMGIARSDPTTATVFQALILAMRSSPYAERREAGCAPS
jgi:hypothetical protein